MSFVSLKSAFISGLSAKLVKVECDIGRGINSFNLIGLGDKAVEESKERVSSALRNSGYSNPRQVNQKTTIALAPGNLKKEGTTFDLAIAIAYLINNKEIKVEKEEIDNSIFIGELSLEGKLSRLNGALAIVELALKHKIKNIYLPKENIKEASLVKGINIYGANSLLEVIDHLTNSEKIIKAKNIDLDKIIINHNDLNEIDLDDIKGQVEAKRALTIAIAGGHNIALYGPPGTGKTMLAKAARKLLPNLSYGNILETTKIHSIANLNSNFQSLILTPPFRHPHHTSSYVSLVGGGTNIRPGEVTLAHNGILFLDEFPEFEKKSLEALREPMEDGYISISRAKGTEKFPAKFILIAAMNPCPCGYKGSKIKPCTCSTLDLTRYERKLSGPIMDRIDLWINVSNIPYKELIIENNNHQETDLYKKNILKARNMMTSRFKDNPKIIINNDLNAKTILRYIKLDENIKKEFDNYANRLAISPRVYYKVIKVARTIADLDNSLNIESKHLLEALNYRPKINN